MHEAKKALGIMLAYLTAIPAGPAGELEEVEEEVEKEEEEEGGGGERRRGKRTHAARRHHGAKREAEVLDRCELNQIEAALRLGDALHAPLQL